MPFRSISREGIKYKDLSPLEKEEYEEKFGNPEIQEKYLMR
jgi:hypothetical protein